MDIERESSDTKNMGDTGKKCFKLKQMNSAESWTIVFFHCDVKVWLDMQIN